MDFYVFDDKDRGGDFTFGIATVPLQDLACNKAVEGNFTIIDQNGHHNGINLLFFCEYFVFSVLL